MVVLITGNRVFKFGLSRGMSYPERVILPIVTLGTIDVRIAELREMARSFSIRLHSETRVSGGLGVDPLDMPRTPYWVGKGKRSQ